MARTNKAKERERRRERLIRVELAIGLLTAGTLSGITVADYISRGKINEVLAGALITLALTALGRIADLRAQRLEDDSDD